jgi:hypothetical protein
MNWIKKLFKRKTELEKLEDKYNSLIEESYRLSWVNRTKSDELKFEANEVLTEMAKLERELYNKDRNL